MAPHGGEPVSVHSVSVAVRPARGSPAWLVCARESRALSMRIWAENTNRGSGTDPRVLSVWKSARIRILKKSLQVLIRARLRAEKTRGTVPDPRLLFRVAVSSFKSRGTVPDPPSLISGDVGAEGGVWRLSASSRGELARRRKRRRARWRLLASDKPNRDVEAVGVGQGPGHGGASAAVPG